MLNCKYYSLSRNKFQGSKTQVLTRDPSWVRMQASTPPGRHTMVSLARNLTRPRDSGPAGKELGKYKEFVIQHLKHAAA